MITINSQETTLADYYYSCLKVIPKEKLVLGIEYVNNDFYSELKNICSIIANIRCIFLGIY